MNETAVISAVAAWTLLLTLIAMLAVVVYLHPRRGLSKSQGLVVVIASLLIALLGAITATGALGFYPNESVRVLIILLRGVATALYLGVLIDVSGWRPPDIAGLIRRGLVL